MTWSMSQAALLRLQAAGVEFYLADKAAHPLQLLKDIKAVSTGGLPVPKYLRAEAGCRAAKLYGWDRNEFDPQEIGLPFIRLAANAGSAEALSLLSRAAEFGFFADKIDQPGIVEWLIKATRAEARPDDLADLAMIYDRNRIFGIDLHTAQSIADYYYQRALIRRILSAAKQSESFLGLGDMAALGQGYVYPTLARSWRQALYFWLRAANSRHCLTLAPRPSDFRRPYTPSSTAAIVRIADLFSHGKGVNRDRRRAARLLYAIRRESGAAQYEVGMLWSSGRLRTTIKRPLSRLGELNAARRHFKAAIQHSKSQFRGAAQNEAATKLEIKARRENVDVLAVIDDDDLALLRMAALGGRHEALVIEAIIRVLLPSPKYDALFPGSARAESVRALWRSAKKRGYTEEPALEAVIESDNAIEALIACSERRLREIMPPPFAAATPIYGAGSNLYQIKDVEAVAIARRGRVSAEELWWLDMRCRLSELLCLDDLAEWQRLISDVQLAGPLLQRISQDASQLGRHENANIKAQIEASTRDVGPVFNALDKSGVIIPHSRQAPLWPKPGWNNVHALIIEGKSVKILGERARFETPLITKEDVLVLLCLALLDDKDRPAGSDFSLSLDPIDLYYQSTNRWRFLRKKFSPDWLAATDIGRSMYFDDRLLVDAGDGGALLCLKPGASLHRERNKETIKPWASSAQAGGFRTTTIGRLMVDSRFMPNDPRPEAARQEKSGRKLTIRIVETRGFIDGGEIAMVDGKLCKTAGALNWRCGAWRQSMALAENYKEMEEAFPVYRRTRLLKGLYASIHGGLKEVEEAHLRQLKRYLLSIRSRYVEAIKGRPDISNIVTI